MEQEDQPLLARFARLAAFELGDGLLIGIVFRRDVTIAPGKDAHVKITGRHIGQTLVLRPLIRGDVILHGDHIMTHLPKSPIDRLTMLFEVAVGGREIDFCHGLLALDRRRRPAAPPGHGFNGVSDSRASWEYSVDPLWTYHTSEETRWEKDLNGQDKLYSGTGVNAGAVCPQINGTQCQPVKSTRWESGRG
jgi:hypothetical protein